MSHSNGTIVTSNKNQSSGLYLVDWRLLLPLLLFFVMGLSVLNDVFVYIPDSARYLVWAQSLSQFHGLTDASGPDPIRYVVHAPLYAVLLAPAALVAAVSVPAAKVVTLLFGLALLLLVNIYLAEHLGKTPAILGTWVLALNPLLILYSTQILSDVPFAALLLAILILIDRVVKNPTRSGRLLVLLVILISAAMLLREVGVALVIACAFLFLIRKEYARMTVLLLVPLCFYAAWLLRNEVLVAGLEHPPLRNADLFASHLYTVREAPLASELLARLKSNLHAYSGIAGKLLFFTQYDARGYGVIPPGEFAFGWILKNTSLLWMPVSILTFGFFVLGLWSDWKKRESTRVVIFFLFFYLILILVYPFNDMRFLFPLLVLMLVFGASGLVYAIGRIQNEKWSMNRVLAGAVVLLFLAIPNIAWVYSFVDNNSRYRSDAESYFRSVVARPDAPELLMFPMSRVGEWLSANTKPSDVIAGRWKQLSFWLDGRKLLELNPMLPLDQFENQMRDYRVKYLVAVLDRSRLREFETQMALSSRFSFLPVHRIGNAVILKVESGRNENHGGSIEALAHQGGYGEKGVLDSLNIADEQIQYLFRSALRSMEAGKANEAESIFQSLTTRAGRSGIVVLNTAIAQSFAGKYQEADTLLRNIREGQQAGPLLVHSWYHLQIIEKLRQAEHSNDPSERADLFTKIAADYWSLGFRSQAERILGKAVGSDPGFQPALVFGIYFSLLREDTLSASQRVKQLRASDFTHPAAERFESLLTIAASATGEKDPAKQAGLREAVAREYERLGLTESAIDELTALLEADAARLTALHSLARIYLDKQRYAPAKRVLDRIAELDPDNPELKNLRTALKDRWGN